MRIIKFFFILLSFTCFSFPVYSATAKSNYSEKTAKQLLAHIHSKIVLRNGSFKDELPEQVMSVMFISPNDKVLELGGNIGRNSCVISFLLKNSSNLVVVESDPESASYLIANRNRNRFLFHVENAAISHIPLMQSGWTTVPFETTLPPGFFRVKTITYEQLKEKYKIQFNVLVADCEGALYHIFQGAENILEDVSLIIVENNFHDRSRYENVRSKFLAHGFQLVYKKAGPWGPCAEEFYQVWKKI